MSKYLIEEPEQVYDFSLDPASVTFTDSPPTTDGTSQAGSLILAGDKSLRLSNQADAGTQLRFTLPGLSIDMSGTDSDDDLIHIRMGFENGTIGQDLGNGSSVRFMFQSGGWAGYAWGSQWYARDVNEFRNQWDIATLKKSDYSYNGTFTTASWGSIDTIVLDVKSQFTPYLSDLTFDGIFVNGDGKPAITLSCDDGHGSLYDPGAVTGM